MGDQSLQFITTHLSYRPREQTSQADELLSWLADPACSPPRILCGDLNAWPGTATYRKFRSRLLDVQESKAFGWPRNTFPARLPLVRIDHVFHSPDVRVISARAANSVDSAGVRSPSASRRGHPLMKTSPVAVEKRARILVPGRNCWVADAKVREAGLLIDGKDYYRAFHDAARDAKQHILIAGWHFTSGVRLLRGKEGEVSLLDFLKQLCSRNPELRVYILAWDYSVNYSIDWEWNQKAHFEEAGDGQNPVSLRRQST